MCSIVGALIYNLSDFVAKKNVSQIVGDMFTRANIRGRDGFGYSLFADGKVGTLKAVGRSSAVQKPLFPIAKLSSCIRIIGNARAEPTTEWVKQKREDDQQPYSLDHWSIVHNGTIANDWELRSIGGETLVQTDIDSASIVETLEHYYRLSLGDLFGTFTRTIEQLKGSYAIIAAHKSDLNSLYLACNYRPIWMLKTDEGVFFGSSRESFGEGHTPTMLAPYSMHSFRYNWFAKELEHIQHNTLKPAHKPSRALVVCSGGLDSVVSAQYVKDIYGMDTELIHFQYGSRAAGPELEAIKEVARFMKVKLHVRQIPAYDPTDSNLLNPDSKIAGGEEGAEFAHEWVPARNLLLLATATAFAEAKGFDYIVLGNNLEEAGAYPDNEPEFIARFQDLLRFAVGDGKFLDVLQPVGNLMKHEIVKLGHEIKAPMHLTWSCYKAGKLHCGKCGPCFMRKTAFDINGLPESIQYQE